MTTKTLPLTTSQHAMWLLHTISGRGELFNVAECLEFKGKIAKNILQEALAHVWLASDSLSCRFIHDETYTPNLEFNKNVPSIKHIHIDMEPDNALIYCKNFISPKLQQPIDLSKNALLQLYLVSTPTQDYLLLLAHHLLLDGYGFGLFNQALNRTYNAIYNNKPLPNLRFSQQQDLLNSHKKDTYIQQQKLAKETLNSWLDNIDIIHSFSDSKASVTCANSRLSAQFTRTDWHTIQSAAALCKASSSEILLASIAAALVAKTKFYHVTLGLIMMNRKTMAELSSPCMQSNVLPLPLLLTPDMNLHQVTDIINKQIKALKKLQSYRVESLKRDRQKQKKPLTVFGPTVNLLPFSSNPKYSDINTQSHILSAGTTDDIMIQIHLLSDVPATLDFDTNTARYNAQDTTDIQTSIFATTKYWSAEPKLSLNSICEAKKHGL